MFTKDKSLISSSVTGCFPDMDSLYSTIPREARLHMERVAGYGETLYRYMLRKDAQLVSCEMGGEVERYSKRIFQYHDIGRHYIPVSIVNKAGSLTDEEYQIVKNHTINAEKAIKSIYHAPFPDSVMKQLHDVAVFHHERYDGKGYPYGLRGTQIPFGARICAVVDTYDGITSWKPYKRQTTKREAIEIIKNEAGSQFDPYIVDMFCSCAVFM